MSQADDHMVELIRAAPGDDAPRLALAAALIERGDPWGGGHLDDD
jgi:uncharacterized protein (TIGR02996 family)